MFSQINDSFVYTVEGGSEKDLPASLLSARTDVRERQLSSLSSSSAASVSSDERHVLALIQQLRNTVGELQQCVRVEQSRARRQVWLGSFPPTDTKGVEAVHLDTLRRYIGA